MLLIGAWVGLASSAQLGDGVEHYFSVTPLTWGRWLRTGTSGTSPLCSGTLEVGAHHADLSEPTQLLLLFDGRGVT